MTARYYIKLPSALGHFSVVWSESADGPKVSRVLLPGERDAAERLARSAFGGAARQSHPAIVELGAQIQNSLAGDAVEFEVDLLSLDICSSFQRSVLLAEYMVPRGWVTTYGRIAAHLGVSGGARAVGGALAGNPFPIVIPCHRAIRSDGTLGGFQGGLAMKRTLLAYEGIELSDTGRVLTRQIYF